MKKSQKEWQKSFNKIEQHISWQERPRPRIYWQDLDKEVNTLTRAESLEEEEPEVIIITTEPKKISEEDLYPILIEFLKSELGLYCQRIDDKCSRNTQGNAGNQWLHPDIVALELVDEHWDQLIQNRLKQGAGARIRLWSFEVKKELNVSNVRKSFFQTLSNSSWANEGYLVTTYIADSMVEQELRMLSAVHGIGVILLTPDNPSESKILLPAKANLEVDWRSVNRLLVENVDFKNYIELVSISYQTSKIRPQEWNTI
ncbi:MAG: hypothetical protein QNJ54_34615 [Prochloraceae cyanobacterium]|nr:hypothetical protein [Prochloraceae cyanobacterium]